MPPGVPALPRSLRRPGIAQRHMLDRRACDRACRYRARVHGSASASSCACRRHAAPGRVADGYWPGAAASQPGCDAPIRQGRSRRLTGSCSAMAGSDAMKDLRAGIVDYLDLRRSLGFKLKTDERLLLDFAAFMERRGATRITSKLALAWAQRPETTDPNYLAGRLRAGRSFARYRILTYPRTEIPPTDLLPRQRSAFQPHIFHKKEVARLLAASLQRLRGSKPTSRWSPYAIFAFLSVPGMRVSEALNLDLGDVDFDHGVLTIRNSKVGKSLLVPLHVTKCATPQLYLSQRNR